MSRVKFGILLSAIITVSVAGSFELATHKPTANETLQVKKEVPNIVLQARADSSINLMIEKLETELKDKYHLNIGKGYSTENNRYISFLQFLLNDEETAQKLASYNVIYMAYDEFSASSSGGHSFIHIDIRLNPRAVLEYIQTH